MAVWLASAIWIVHALTSKAFARAARRLAERWFGLTLEAKYRPVPPVTRMSTGFWWDGRKYHKSEREARRNARSQVRVHDAQVYWDGLWTLVAGVTVLPIAASPLLALIGGITLIATPGLLPYAVALLVAALAAAPFAWRILRPLAVRLLGPVPSSGLGKRVRELEQIRADLTETQAAELERIERGLHDGAQARLVALGMTMQAAERLVDNDPDAAKALLAEARKSSVAALTELRSLVRGINPPVLVERGLIDAIHALALDATVEVSVEGSLPGRAERPVESAVYFAVAELLANVAKHARASYVTVDLGYADRVLIATVTDDGTGGASAGAGSGLAGLERRARAFGGTLTIDSPAGGPTRITVAVPCELS
ncbi:histidine kinase [Actinoplanes sp. NPDC051411]|uniref:sensor histidine kinase n=1 Tax=Actinoplanes sp. NPDC051411 TaxID=3155522 RepID=UPI00341211C7